MACFLFMFGCSEDEPEVAIKSQKDQGYFAIREMDGSIATVIESDLLVASYTSRFN